MNVNRRINKLERNIKVSTIVIWTLCFFAILFLAAQLKAQTVEGNAVFWYDGDTIKFRQQNGKYLNVRIIGIDAPESRQSYGQEAKARLMEKTKSIALHLQILGKDTYGRTLGYLFSDEEPDIGLSLITEGFAWEYSAPLVVRSAYQTAEQDARSNQRGLWLDSSPRSPASFRNKCSP